MTGLLHRQSVVRRRRPRPVRTSLSRPSWPATHPLIVR